jgi:hypothetical protein
VKKWRGDIQTTERESRHDRDNVGEKRGRRIIKGWKRVSMMGWMVVVAKRREGTSPLLLSAEPFACYCFCFVKWYEVG